MAHTLRPRLSRRARPNAGAVARLVREFWQSVERAWRIDPKRVLWLAMWSPFWIGSDAPRPARPGAPAELVSDAPITPAGAWLVHRVDQVTRRFRIGWIAGSMLRGIALALAVLAIWAVLSVAGVVGLPGWIPVGAVLAAGVTIGAVYGWLARPSRLMLARMLDRTFRLDERMVTAFDRQIDGTYVSRLQLADAANTLDEILADVPRSTYLPIREAALCLIAAGALVTGVLANVPNDPIDPVGPPPVPAFVPASERLAVRENPLPQRANRDQPQAEQASLADIQEQSRVAQTARDDLATLGEALEHHPVTQPAAGSIAAGDYPDAADSLRSAAGAASTLTQAERDGLADQLETAAEAIGESNPELAQAASDAADALREGGPIAENALNNLADQIDHTGSQAESPGGAPPNLDESNPGSGAGSTSEQGGQSGESAGAQDGGESGPATDPGAGVDAAPGVTSGTQDQQAEGGADGGSDSGGAASEGGGDAPQPGQGSSPSDVGTDGAPAGSGGDGQQQGLSGAPDEETGASQGSGAGTGQTGANDQNNGDSSVDSPMAPEEPGADTEVPAAGEAGDPPPSRADRGEEDDATGTGSGGSNSLQLGGVSDENVPSGGSSGSSSLGSGSGSSTSSGSESGGSVGLAGPDSNSVPDSLRDVVQGYFDGPRP